MSAASHAILEASSPLEGEPSMTNAHKKVYDLVHDLRQPLSSIEAIAYYLEMTLPAEQQETRHYMRRLQQLIDQTSSILSTLAEVQKPERSDPGIDASKSHAL